MTRIPAGNSSDLADGQMKEIPLNPQDAKSPKVLLSKLAGKYYATSSKCTHYGAPLAKGVLNAKTSCVTCPWHGARFNVCTGDIEDAPGLGNLYRFNVAEENGQIFVEANEDAVRAFQRPPVGKCGKADDAGVVVVGGGNGGHSFVEEVRQAGYKGRVTLVTRDDELPIDRTKLSKALITDPKKIALRDEAFYKDLDVQVLTSMEVTALDFRDSTVSLSSGSKLPYSHLVLATGSVAKTLPFPGKELKGIHTLRTIADARAIDVVLGTPEHKSQLVIIGSSFIGMELAIAASSRAEVSVIGMERAPFEAVLGSEVGNGIRKVHESKGVKFYMEAGVEKFIPSESDPSRVAAVLLKSGESLPCSAVVLGVGVSPATELISSAGVSLEKDGSVLVDAYLRVVDTATNGKVFAIGDIAKFPNAYADGLPTRIEHWNVAGNHGRSVARFIAGQDNKYESPAIFWSAQGSQLRYVSAGVASNWTDVYVDGSLEEMKFVAYYRGKKGEVVAVASSGRDPVVAACTELFRNRRMPSFDEIKGGVDPLKLQL